MLFFNRLFASYYFISLQIRKDTEDGYSQAMFFVLASQALLLGMVLEIIRKIFGISMAHMYINKLLVIFVVLIFIFLGYLYFLSNRTRRNRIVDDYRVLPKLQKYLWTAISILLILGPFVYFLSR